MKRILIMMMAVVAVFATSCEEKEGTKIVDITVALVNGTEAFNVEGINVKLEDLSGGAVYEAATDATGTAMFSVPAGLYQASVSYKMAADGNLLLYNGVNSSISVVAGKETAFTIALTESQSNQIIIKEAYFGGCPSDDGSKTFSNDGYVILYNNSSEAADASDICFAFATPFNSNGANKWMVDGKLLYEAEGWIPAGYSCWWFTSEVIIEPYSQIVVSLYGAIDHTATYSNSVNLSDPSYYAMYAPEIYTNAKYKVAEGIPSSHYLNTYLYCRGNAWPLSGISPALYVFKNSTTEAYTKDATNLDTRENAALPVARIPIEWVVDGVDVFNAAYAEKNIKRFTPSIDAGYVNFTNKLGYSVYRNVDKAATEALAENEGKLVYNYAGGTTDVDPAYGTTDPSGINAEASIAAGAHIIYMDTNNSTNDFHQRKFASLTGK